MSMGIYSGRYAEKKLLLLSAFFCFGVYLIKLNRVISNKKADLFIHRKCNVCVCFIVSVKVRALHRKTRA